MGRKKDDNTLYEIRKYDPRVAKTVEVLPHKYKGRREADHIVEFKNSQLTPEEKELGIEWYHNP